MKTARRFAAAAVLALGASAAALASPASAGVSAVTIASDPATSHRHISSYAGSASYDSDAHLLTVTLTNTSPAGYLRGFAFDAAGDAKAVYVDGDNAATKHDEDAFDALTRGHGGRYKPFGTYETGAAIDGKWNRPHRSPLGIAAGASHTFTFNVTGAAADESIMDLLSGGSGPRWVASFRRYKQDKGDQVGATLTPVVAPSAVVVPDSASPSVAPTDDGPASGSGNTDGGVIVHPGTGGPGPSAVPLPPAALSGAGMMGLAAWAQFRRRRFGRGA